MTVRKASDHSNVDMFEFFFFIKVYVYVRLCLVLICYFICNVLLIHDNCFIEQL